MAHTHHVLFLHCQTGTSCTPRALSCSGIPRGREKPRTTRHESGRGRSREPGPAPSPTRACVIEQMPTQVSRRSHSHSIRQSTNRSDRSSRAPKDISRPSDPHFKCSTCPNLLDAHSRWRKLRCSEGPQRGITGNECLENERQWTAWLPLSVLRRNRFRVSYFVPCSQSN
jgi:hypothetical protein